MFPWFGKIAARTDAAAAAAKAAQSRYEARQVQLFSEVKQAFYEYAYLAGATRVAKENLALMQHFEEVARTKHLTAAATHPDILRAQIEVAKLQNELDYARAVPKSHRRPAQCPPESSRRRTTSLAS